MFTIQQVRECLHKPHPVLLFDTHQLCSPQLSPAALVQDVAQLRRHRSCMEHRNILHQPMSS